MAIRVQRHANVSKQATLWDGVDVTTLKWRVYGCGLNRFVHEGMNTISNVKDHLKTRSGNVNIRKKQPLTTSYQRGCDVIDVDTTLFRWHVPAQGNILSIIMGIIVRKPVFGVTDKASFKPISSATKTS